MGHEAGRGRRGAATSVVVALVALSVAEAGGPLYAQPLLSAAQVFKKASPSIGRLVLFDAKGQEAGTASAFVVAEDGLVATSYHCLADKKEGFVAHRARVELPGRSAHEVLGVVASDARRDWALLKVGAQGLPALRLGDAAKLEKGDPVIAIGYPAGLEARPTTGTFSGWHEEQILHDASTSSGNSGGPLLDSAGNVVGITRGELRSTTERVALNDLFFAVDIKPVASALTGATSALTKLPIVPPASVRAAAKAGKSGGGGRAALWVGGILGAGALAAGAVVAGSQATEAMSVNDELGQFAGMAAACSYQTHPFQLRETTTVDVTVQGTSSPLVSLSVYVFVGQCSGQATFANTLRPNEPSCEFGRLVQLGACRPLDGGGFLLLPNLPAGPYTIAVHNPSRNASSYSVVLRKGF
jgi:S1-C subfamily serine protease